MRIGWIDYLNTLPFNFEKTGLNPDFHYDLIKGVPSQINNLLSKKKIDLGFISSAHYIENFSEYLILPDLSISSLNKVRSVIILSDKPLEEINEIYLTKASKTSRYLTMVIFKNFLNKNVNYRDLENEYFLDKEAVLLIGDSAIKYAESKKYSYDLSSIWYKKTKLPFVFALWCVRKDFYKENKEEIKKFHKILKESKNKFFENPEKYVNKDKKAVEYLKNLDYCLSSEHLRSLELFSEYLLEINIIQRKPIFLFAEV